jgi:hypothetical protein
MRRFTALSVCVREEQIHYRFLRARAIFVGREFL